MDTQGVCQFQGRRCHPQGRIGPRLIRALKPAIPDAKLLAETKMRIVESERALLRLAAGSTPTRDEIILRVRFTRQLREALEDYFSLLSGQDRETAAKDN